MTRFQPCIIAAVVCIITPTLFAQQDKPADGGGAALNEREKQFQQKLSGAVLAGSFTLGNQGDQPGQVKLHQERYTIQQVAKLQGDTWVFMARVQYGGKDVTVPIPIQVTWAGDTPVISLTKLAIPKLGTYTARVLIYGDDYAGTWNGGDHGGHLFGRIIRSIEAAKPPTPDSAGKGK